MIIIQLYIYNYINSNKFDLKIKQANYNIKNVFQDVI